MMRLTCALLSIALILPLTGCGGGQSKPEKSVATANTTVHVVSYEITLLSKDDKGVTSELPDSRKQGKVSLAASDESIRYKAPGGKEMSGKWMAADSLKARLLVTGDKGMKQEVEIPLGGSKDLWFEGDSHGWRIKVQEIQKFQITAPKPGEKMSI
jgi:hypothetical protein